MKTQIIQQARFVGICLAAVTLGTGAFAASGTFGAYLGITPQGGSQTIYGGQQSGPTFTTDFGGADLGDINLGDTFTLSFAEVLTWKDGISDVTGAELNYRVYASGTPTGTFTALGIGFGSNAPSTDILGNAFSGGGDQSWNSIASTPDIASGLSAGDYVLEVYWRATSSDGDHFVNNGGANFAADFTIVPEPSTYALLAGLAALTLVALRRRKER